MDNGSYRVPSSKDVEMMERRTELSNLYQQGMRRKKDLADALGVSYGTLYKDLQAIEAEYSEAGRALSRIRDSERFLTLMRLEAVHFELYNIMINPSSEDQDRIKAAQVLKQNEETRMKLLGTASPSKIAYTNPEGDGEYSGGLPEELKEKLMKRRQRRLERESIKEIEEAEVVDYEDQEE